MSKKVRSFKRTEWYQHKYKCCRASKVFKLGVWRHINATELGPAGLRGIALKGPGTFDFVVADQ